MVTSYQFENVFKSWSECFICLVDWYRLALQIHNLLWIKHLEETFGIDKWTNTEECWMYHSYVNPFPFSFMQEHFYKWQN